MSKFDEALSTYLGEAQKLGISVDKALLEKVTKGLGPSIYNADSAKVASSDPKELERVKQNFLIKKLGLADGPELDGYLAGVVEKLGSSNPNKYRALFYYLMVKDTGKESVY
jgi:hypothetical protein